MPRPGGRRADAPARRHDNDEVVFTNTYFFDLGVALDRSKPSLLLGEWDKPARDLPDSLKRQLMEGAEFEPATGKVLITREQFVALVGSGRRIFIIVETGRAGAFPGVDRWPVIATSQSVGWNANASWDVRVSRP